MTTTQGNDHGNSVAEGSISLLCSQARSLFGEIEDKQIRDQLFPHALVHAAVRRNAAKAKQRYHCVAVSRRYQGSSPWWSQARQGRDEVFWSVAHKVWVEFGRRLAKCYDANGGPFERRMLAPLWVKRFEK